MTPDEKVHQLEYEVQRLKDLIKRIEEPPKFRSIDAPITALNAELDATIKGIRILTGRISEDYPRDIAEIEFINSERFGLLRLLTVVEDECDIALIARVYEARYRACIAELQNRELRIKLTARDSYLQKLEADRDRRIAQEEKKIARQEELEKKREKNYVKENDPERYKRISAEERALKSMMDLGMSKEMALAQLNAVKGIK